MLIYGAGPQGGVIAATLRAQGIEPNGFIDDSPEFRSATMHDLRVLGGQPYLDQSTGNDRPGLIVAIGSNAARRTVAARLRARNLPLINAIHPSATVMDDVCLGDDLFIAAGAIVVTGTEIGNDAVINTGAAVDHDSRVGAGAYLSPGVRTSGKVDVGEQAFIGMGALLGPGVHIGAGAIVGAGSVVLDEVPPRCFVAGAPARILREDVTLIDWGRLLGGRRAAVMSAISEMPPAPAARRV